VKALVLAGGSGTRLRPISHTGAKQLVPVAGRPILFHGLDQVAAAGITEVGIVVGETADDIVAAVGDGSAWGLSVTYLRQEAPLGLAHAVLIARDFLGDDDFVMYLGDNLLEEGIAGCIRRFEAAREHRLALDPDREPVAQILLARVPDPGRFGVAVLGERGEVVGLVEKPVEPPSDLALVGVYLFDRHIHEAVRAITPSKRGELEITDAIQWLIDEGHHVAHDVLEGWWIDTGKLTPLLEANRLLLEKVEARNDGSVDDASVVEGRVVIEEGAEIVASIVRGPAVIGAGTKIVRSYIGPFTAIERGCTVVDSEVEHSILLAGGRLEDAGRLIDSLVGRDAVVTRSQRRPTATRLMVGDHSHVDLAR
jgi:glucose-1-phosphate thymidylyltransferase